MRPCDFLVLVSTSRDAVRMSVGRTFNAHGTAGIEKFVQESLAFTFHSSAESKLHSEAKTWHHYYLSR